MRFILFSILLFSSSSLFAYKEPQTLYTINKYYITFGEVDFNKPASEVAITLLKYNEYSNWALSGMQGIDKDSEGLIAYFTGIEYCAQEDVFIIFFDVNLIWPFGSKGNKMYFKPVQTFNGRGELVSIKLIPKVKIKLVKEALFEFGLSALQSRSALRRYILPKARVFQCCAALPVLRATETAENFLPDATWLQREKISAAEILHLSSVPYAE